MDSVETIVKKNRPAKVEPSVISPVEPVVQPIVQPVVQPVVEPIIPVTSEIPPVVPPVTYEPEIPDHYKKIDELSGGKLKFTKDEELKAFVNQHEKYKTDLESRKERDLYIDDMEKFIEEEAKHDPTEQYGGADNYRKMVIANELAKKGTKEIGIRFLESDVNKMEDIDVLSLFEQFQVPKLVGKDKTSKELALQELGIETSTIEDWNNIELSEIDQAKVAKKATTIRKDINELIAKVDVPKPKDFINDWKTKSQEQKTKTETLKSEWQDARNRITASINKIERKDFSFEITEDTGELVSSFISEAAKKGWKPDEANVLTVTKAIQKALRDKYEDKFNDAYETHLSTKLKQEFDKEHNNLQPITSTISAPVDNSLTEAQSKVRKMVIRT